MDVDVDHYAVLGLPSGEEGSRLSEKEINKAYRSKAMKLHPDKNPDDPNANANFLKLQTSYEVLKGEKTRKLFDDILRVKRAKIHQQGQQDPKRRKMKADLVERERYASDVRAREEEERRSRKLREELARARAMHNRKMAAASTRFKKHFEEMEINSRKARTLKVSWEKVGEDYTEQRLRDIFGSFGSVERVDIRRSKKKGSALVVMSSRDAAANAIGNVLGDLSNPLLVLPLQPVSSPPVFNAERRGPDGPKSGNIAGVDFKTKEQLVLEKMRQAAQKESNA